MNPTRDRARFWPSATASGIICRFERRTLSYIDDQVEEHMPTQVQLSDEDVTFLLTFLRSATSPVTTQQLIDALRNRVR